MRALLEFRLAERWGQLLLTATAVLMLAAVLIFWGLSWFEYPSRPLLLACLFLLIAVWYDARRAEVSDRAEKREALHAVLPATRLAQGFARAAEPLFPIAAAALVMVAGFLVLGRGAVFSVGPWRDDLLLALGVASWLLTLESAQLVAREAQIVLRKLGVPWLFWIGVVLLFGGPGLLFGIVLGEGSALPYFFYLAIGRPGSIALALVLAMLLALLSVFLYRDRDAMLGAC